MRDGFITILDRNFQRDEKPGDFGELRTKCQVSSQGEAVLIRYNESVENINDCETCLKVESNRVTMMRAGRYRTTMIFEKEKRHTACYETPFGEVMIGVYTKVLNLDFNKSGGAIVIGYTIDTYGDYISENELQIIVKTEVNEDVRFS